ncbi:MAG: hypothetical protein QM831_40995 [Kofleriaceae bacterium]
MKLAFACLCVVVSSSAAEPTGTLDFVVDQKGTTYVLHDDAYTLTFPGKPDISVQDQQGSGTPAMKFVSASYAAGADGCSFLLLMVPDNTAYDIDKGMTGARDGAVSHINGKLVREVDASIGTLKGKHAFIEATIEGKKSHVDLYLAWDEKHRSLVGLITATDQSAPTKAQKAFVASFKTSPKGATPH